MPKHGGNSLAPYSGRNSIFFDIILLRTKTKKYLCTIIVHLDNEMINKKTLKINKMPNNLSKSMKND